MTDTQETVSLDALEAEIERMEGALHQLTTQLIKPLEKDCNGIRSTIKDIADKLREDIERLQAEARAKIELQREALKAKDELLSQARDKSGELSDYLDALARARAERIKLSQAQSALALLEERWEKMLIGAPWREWAKDHQIIAAKQWAQQKTLILADDMGLGKTLEAIMAFDFIKAATSESSPDNPYEADEEVYWTPDGYQTKYVNGIERPSGLRILYLCPSSLIRNVIEELRKWAPHRSVVPVGNLPEAQREFAMNTADEIPEFVMVLNYEAWRFNKRLISKLASLNFDSIVLDEAHNFKDTTSEVYKGIKQLADDSDIGFVMPMTGTPILNKPEDLYPMLYLIDPVKYNHKTHFLNEFCRQTMDGKWKFKDGGEQALRARLGKKYLRRTKDDAGIELPDQTVQVHSIKVIQEDWPQQAAARKSMREHAHVMLGKKDEFGNPKAISAAAKIAVYTRLRQIETWPAGIVIKDQHGAIVDRLDVEESQKLDYVVNGEAGLLPDILSSNRRCVVFSQFREPLYEIQRRIEALGYRAAVLDGDTSIENRNRISRDFDRKHQDGNGVFEWHVVLANYRVGGVGLNFTSATETIILDEEWNPGKRDQAYARTNRIGQEEPTTVHILRMERTIDDWLAAIMDQKEKLVDGWDNAVPDLEDFIKNSNESGLM